MEYSAPLHMGRSISTDALGSYLAEVRGWERVLERVGEGMERLDKMSDMIWVLMAWRY